MVYPFPRMPRKVSAGGLKVQDVFSIPTWTGNGSVRAITNGLDQSTYGGMDWIKLRADNSGAGSSQHSVWDTDRGANKALCPNSTAAQQTYGSGLTAFGSSGFSLGADGGFAAVNEPTNTYAAWSFREAAKFFKKGTVSHTNGAADTVDLSTLGVVGFVLVKRVDGASNWFAFHRSQSSGSLTYLNLTSAQASDASISISGTTLTIASSLTTGSYAYYAWAHDPDSTRGIIQCGGFTTVGNSATVSLPWEPQFVIMKVIDSGGSWLMLDQTRFWGSGSDACLLAESASVEALADRGAPTSSGFTVANQAGFSDFVYMAIRKGPM
jgi:hypothetical protein